MKLEDIKDYILDIICDNLNYDEVSQETTLKKNGDIEFLGEDDNYYIIEVKVNKYDKKGNKKYE